MLLHTLTFFLTYCIAFIGYWKLPAKYRWYWLLLFGLVTYASWSPTYVLFIGLLSLLTFVAGLKIPSQKAGYRWLITVIVFLVFVLVVFKQAPLFTNAMTIILTLFGWEKSVTVKLALPIGISFYTFQAMGYLFDVYRRKIKAVKNFGQLWLFLTFSPIQTAGPIERADHLLPQLLRTHTFSYPTIVRGLKLFTYGLFLKLVIADNLAIVVNEVFNALPEYKGLSLLFGLFLYSWQIYADFSGYTNMARGIALTFNINILPNFNRPYSALSVSDFWRRWHMSLSFWFKDYVYIPLGGSRQGWLKTIRNTLVIFILCGLWHGSSWLYVFWGIYHATFILIERLLRSVVPKHLHVPKFISIGYTFCVVSFSWVFFRAKNLNEVSYILKNCFEGAKNYFNPSYITATFGQIYSYNQIEMFVTSGILFLIIGLEFFGHTKPLQEHLGRLPAIIRYSIYVIMVFGIIQLRNADIKEFIYLRF